MEKIFISVADEITIWYKKNLTVLGAVYTQNIFFFSLEKFDLLADNRFTVSMFKYHGKFWRCMGFKDTCHEMVLLFRVFILLSNEQAYILQV